MTTMNRFGLAAFVFCLLFCLEGYTQGDWIACGDDQVLLIDSKAPAGAPTVVWKWKVSEALTLPETYQKLLVPLDECKPVAGGKRLLITSSSGGVLLLDRATKAILFYANAPMAHSAALLPGDRIVVALSTHRKGNSIEVYDVARPEQCVFKDSLYSGHGVVWNQKKRRLFALGFNELRAYALKDWDTQTPRLELIQTWKVPDEGGHDLSPVDQRQLLVTTHHNVFVFDVEAGTFRIFDPLARQHNIKSVNYNNTTRSLVYTQAEQSWWTHRIYQKNPETTIEIPDVRLYKVRVLDNKNP